jgi:aspartate aminotransferase
MTRAALRMRQLSGSAAVELANSVLSFERRQKDYILMHDGELDFATPAPVVEATQRALADGRTRYDDLKGLLILREAICEKLHQDYGIICTPEEILVSNGSSQAIFEIFQSYIDPGDHVLVPAPAWPTYIEDIRLAGGVPVTYPCLSSDLDLELIRSLVHSRTKMMVINSPHNPTGIVLSKKTLEGLAELAAEQDMLILCDEAYENFVHSGAKHYSLSAIAKDHRSRILTTRSFSKTYSMTGFRIGYLHADTCHIRRCSNLHTHMSDNVCTFAQYGAHAAISLPNNELITRSKIVEDRVLSAYNAVSTLFPCPVPEGGFYVFPSIVEILGDRWLDASAFVSELLRETGVATVAGDAFGCPGHLRMSLAAVNTEEIRSGVGRMKDFVRKFRDR